MGVNLSMSRKSIPYLMIRCVGIMAMSCRLSGFSLLAERVGAFLFSEEATMDVCSLASLTVLTIRLAFRHIESIREGDMEGLEFRLDCDCGELVIACPSWLIVVQVPSEFWLSGIVIVIVLAAGNMAEEKEEGME